MNNQEELDRIFAKLALDYGKLNAKQQAFAIREIGRVRGDIADLLADYAGVDGTIVKRRLNGLLRDLDVIERQIRTNGMTALEHVINDTAGWTTGAIHGAMVQTLGAAVVADVTLDVIDRGVFQYVIRRFGSDGLVLSDRVWRFAGEQRDELNRVLRSAILRGQPVNSMIADVRKIIDNDTWKIRRLVTTESATAQRVSEAYYAKASPVVQALLLQEGACGRKDHDKHRCHELAREDRHGLGAGVFLPDDSEYFSPHPQCTSWYTYVLHEKYR